MMRYGRLAATLVLGLAACNLSPIEDPGIGEHGLTTVVYAADGSVLAQWHAGEDRALVTIDQVPEALTDAVVAIEDERFWAHPGVDLRGVARSLIENLETGRVVQGGSTITQQYLKNVLLTGEVTAQRKVTEAALALRLEEGLDKEEILERYLNTVYFGNGAYGVGTAAAHYFGKDVSALTVGESALLAGLIQLPSATDPFLAPTAALERRRVVLNKMVELSWLSLDEAETADTEPLVLAPPQRPGESRFPYFTEEVKRLLLEDPALGQTATDRANRLFTGGLRIHTTLDPRVQEAAEQALAAVIGDGGPSGALAAVDPRTGHVLALVGGRDFYDSSDPVARFNLATQGRRQPGSAFKPFVLAAALEQGIDLDAVFRAPSTIVIQTDSGPWTVDNYERLTFPDLSLLEATVWSVNTVYAQVVEAVSPARVRTLAKAAGIRSELKALHSVALGAQEVTPLEMASAYGTFAAGGINVAPILVTSIDTFDAVNIYEAVPVVSLAFDREIADAVTGVLGEVVERGTGQAAQIGRPVAGKTGTSQNHADAWFAGYTPELAAAVWVGFADATTPMEPPTTAYPITGGTWPAKVWAAFASLALDGVPYGELAAADEGGTVTVEVDTATGYLAGPLCPRATIQRLQFPAASAPTMLCPVHNSRGLVVAGAGQVPNAVGLSLTDATSLLQQAGYRVQVEWAVVRGLADGFVFGHLPEAGSPAQSGSFVTLEVAGPAPGSVVPSVLGFPVDQAVAELETIGLKANVTTLAEANPEDVRRRPGVVWKQEPAGGAAPNGIVALWANP
jgi:penicillin-binding protein 1A